MKYSGIGGQAVIEGIMMRNGDEYAVAVRKPDASIEVKKENFKGTFGAHKFLKLPFIRGIFNFIDSLVLAMKVTMYSASFYEEEEGGKETEKTEEQKKKEENGFMFLTVCLSVVLAVGLFMVAPVFIANCFRAMIPNKFLMSLLEGLIRIVIFILYISMISVMKDIKRTYMYHGSEHKCINCIEHGLVLNVENVRKSSRFHKRCGTSFLLIVMIISILVFMCVRVDTLLLRIVSRILLIPVVAGISYEFLRLAGRSDNAVVNLLSKPGLALQRLTTKEPDDDMIEVAIEAVEAVFDWKQYLQKNFPEEYAAQQTEAAQEPETQREPDGQRETQILPQEPA